MAASKAELVWEGDCLEVLRTFPTKVRQGFGEEIERVRVGVRPLDSKSMASVGKGVFELRQRDPDGWYRVIYLSRVDDKIHMLHSFVKNTRKTSPNDLNVAEKRLKLVRARLLAEKKNARKNK